MKCGHCEQPIKPAEPYIYQWFPADKIMKPVHAYHIQAKRSTPK